MYILNPRVSLTNLYLAVILLSFVLAVGFLLIILSCALWQNWLPLLVGSSNASLPFEFSDPPASSLDICSRPSPQRSLRPLRKRRIILKLWRLCASRPWTLHYIHGCRNWFRTSNRASTFKRYRSEGMCNVDYRGRVGQIRCPTCMGTQRYFFRLVYATILAYSAAFNQEESDYD